MLPEGVSFNEYKERKIADIYLGQSEPISILTPEGTTREKFLLERKEAVTFLNRVVENARQAAKDGSFIEFDWYTGLLQQIGNENKLIGMGDLVTRLIEHYKKKPENGLAEFYQHALW